MIILEGPDGAGKSTLLERLVDALQEYEVREGHHPGTVNRDRMWETTVERTYSAIGRDLNPAQPPLLWDRMFYSELVYSPVMERPNAFGATSNYVHRLIRYTGSPVIWCMPPLEIILENVSKTKQHSWVSGNEEAIWNRYNQIMDRFAGSQHYLWDYTRDNAENHLWPYLVKQLRTYINKRRTIA